MLDIQLFMGFILSLEELLLTQNIIIEEAMPDNPFLFLQKQLMRIIMEQDNTMVEM